MKNSLINNRLSALEKQISAGLEKWHSSRILVGKCLKEIRDGGLFLERYGTWEEYIEKGWGETRRAFQLIQAYEVTDALPVSVAGKIQNEGQARALVPVPKEHRAEVVKAADKATGGNITAQAIKEAAAEIVPKPEKPAAEQKRILDATKYPVPPPMEAFWIRADSEARDGMRRLKEIRLIVKAAKDEDDLAYRAVNFQRIEASLRDVERMLDQVRPYVVCLYCSGKNSKDCRACKQRGFLDEFFYRNGVPEELKKNRELVVASLK